MTPDKTTDSQPSLPLTALELYRFDMLALANSHSCLSYNREAHFQAIGGLWEQERDEVRAAYTKKADLLLRSHRTAMGFQSKTVGKADRGVSGKQDVKERVKKARKLQVQKDSIRRKRSRRSRIAGSEETRACLDSSLTPLEESGIDSITVPSSILTVSESSSSGESSTQDEAWTQGSIDAGTSTYTESSDRASLGIETPHEGSDDWLFDVSQEIERQFISSEAQPPQSYCHPDFDMQSFLNNILSLSPIENDIYCQNHATSIRDGQLATEASVEDSAFWDFESAIGEFGVRGHSMGDFDIDSFIREMERIEHDF